MNGGMGSGRYLARGEGQINDGFWMGALTDWSVTESGQRFISRKKRGKKEGKRKMVSTSRMGKKERKKEEENSG